MPVAREPATAHRVAVVVRDDAMLVELGVVQELFGPRRPGVGELTGATDSPYDLAYCPVDPGQALPAGLSAQPLEALVDADTVVVPGVADPLRPSSERLGGLLRDAAAAGARMVSLCVGAFALAEAGLLDGRRATTHWVLAERFRERFPRVRLEPQHLFVEDDGVFTSGGLLAATDLGLHLLARDHGQAYANEIARWLISPPHRDGGQAQYSRSLAAPPTGPLEAVQRWMRDHLDEPLTLDDVARHALMSPRTLVRRFRAELGLSVYEWLSAQRVERARELLETTELSIAEIAAVSGLGSAESLRRQFAAHLHTTANAYRATFRAR